MLRNHRGAVPQHPAMRAALADAWRALWSVWVFSGVVNLLMLAGPIYMLQVYDRVLSSRSVATLLALSALLLGALALQALLDAVRMRIVARAAASFDEHLGGVVHNAVIQLAVQSSRTNEVAQPVRDLDQVRAFLTGPGPIAILDLPWIPAFLLICFLIHPWIGVASLIGGAVLFVTTWANEVASRAPARAVAAGGVARAVAVEADRRNAESIIAMGQRGALAQRWSALNEAYLAAVERATDVASTYTSLSKMFRLLLQSTMLGLGAYLVLQEQMSAGAMVAASIMMARAVAPVEAVIGQWRSFIAARQSFHRLKEVLARHSVSPVRTALPAPRHELKVEALSVVAPGSRSIIVDGVGFHLAAGQALGIVGPNGAGKSSLVRTLVGVWPPARGSIRLDGAALDQWHPDDLGPHIGFLAQSVDLFDGTVADNIARMAPHPDPEAVIRAAQAAGAHEMILRLSAGYDTCIGESGTTLSAGQRQRIAMARALYGDAFLIVLDEANANLDSAGEAALLQAIKDAKARGAIVIMIAHRAAALVLCDQILTLQDGRQQKLGPREEVFRDIVPPLSAQRAGSPLPPVPHRRVLTYPGGVRTQ